MEISDYELIMLYHENNEDATRLLFAKYNLILKKIINRYNDIIKYLNMDKNLLYSDALKTFNLGLNQYNNLSDVSFYTYITLLIKRLIKKKIIEYNRPQYNFLRNMISLDADEQFLALKDKIKSNNGDPLDDLLYKEEQNCLKDIAKNVLSKYEYYIYELFLKGLTVKEIVSITKDNEKKVINALQRIKKKLKEQKKP